MAFVVENGTGLSTATSYVSLGEADSYFEDRGITAWVDADDEDKQVSLIKASAFLDATYPWFGRKSTQAQGLMWPRNSGHPILGSTLPPTTFYPLQDSDGYDIIGVPVAVMRATFEASYLAFQGTTLYQDRDPNGRLVKKVIGPIEKDYQPESSNLKPAPPSIFDVLNKLLAGLYCQAGGIQSAKVIRDNPTIPLGGYYVSTFR